MKIYILSENTAVSPEFGAEHGLSMYIEALGKKILFDTGAGSLFAENAAKLGVDLSQVDLVVLSHGHSDHGGGLQKFLELNSKAKIYVAKTAFDKHYNDSDKDISVAPELLASGRFVIAEEKLVLAEGIELEPLAIAQPKYKINTYGLQMEKDGKLVPDDFLHEQYLTIIENGKRIVFSGCSHRGILNIMNWLKPDIVVGGFHFFKLEVADNVMDREYLLGAAKLLQEANCSYYTCHCTGLPQFAFLKQSVKDLEYVSAGSVMEI